MFCYKCGRQIPDQAKFCPFCGADQTVESGDDSQEQTEPSGQTAETGDQNEKAAGNTAPAETGAPAPKAGPEPAGAARKPNARLIGIIAAAAAVLVVVIVIAISSGRRTTVHLDKYVSITFGGYNSAGTASYDFDRTQFDNDYRDKLKVDTKALKKLQKDDPDAELAEELSFWAGELEPSDWLEFIAIDCTISPDEGLSNGDKVTLTWNVSDDDLDMLGEVLDCKFTTKDITATVEGLEDVTTFDAFEGVTVTYEGVSPDGEIGDITRGSDKACEYLRYTADKEQGLSNGDTITITVQSPSGDVSDYCMTNYGKVPEQTTKEFTVEGLASYAASASEIPEETIGKMRSQAEDVMKAKSASWDQYDASLASMEYIGNYFLKSKSGEAGQYGHNAVILVYRMRILAHFGDDAKEGNIDYYWYCRYEDLMELSDGTWSVDLDDYKTPSDDYASFEVEDLNIGISWLKTATVGGYQTLDGLFNNLVTSNIDKYTYEDNVEDTGSAEAETDDNEEEEQESAAEKDDDSDDETSVSWSDMDEEALIQANNKAIIRCLAVYGVSSSSNLGLSNYVYELNGELTHKHSKTARVDNYDGLDSVDPLSTEEYSYTYEYDDQGNVTSLISNNNGKVTEFAYDYDEHGNPIKYYYSSDSHTYSKEITYQYQNDRLISVSSEEVPGYWPSYTVNFTYDEEGIISSYNFILSNDYTSYDLCFRYDYSFITGFYVDGGIELWEDVRTNEQGQIISATEHTELDQYQYTFTYNTDGTIAICEEIDQMDPDYEVNSIAKVTYAY